MGAEIQTALIAYLNSLVQSAPVEQSQVIGPVEPVVSAENQATPVEAASPLKQVSEAEASPQIAACTTIEQVAELIKGWEIPLRTIVLDDGTTAPSESLAGEIVAIRLPHCVKPILDASDDELDEVIGKKQKLVPRFGGLREKVIALATAERTKIEELVPKTQSVNIIGMRNNYGDILKVAPAGGVSRTDQQYLSERELVPDDLFEVGAQKLNQLKIALGRRAVAKQQLEPLMNHLLKKEDQSTRMELYVMQQSYSVFLGSTIGLHF